jgi:hypothetical protein
LFLPRYSPSEPASSDPQYRSQSSKQHCLGDNKHHRVGADSSASVITALRNPAVLSNGEAPHS